MCGVAAECQIRTEESGRCDSCRTRGSEGTAGNQPVSAAGYETGQREPSYPTVGFIAQTFNCNIDFLYGTSDKTDPDYIIVSSSNDPELYSLIKMIKQDSNVEGRILTYARKLLEK